MDKQEHNVFCQVCGNNINMVLFNPEKEPDYTSGEEHFCHECDEPTLFAYKKKPCSHCKGHGGSCSYYPEDKCPECGLTCFDV